MTSPSTSPPTPPPPSPDWEKLGRYLSGESSPEEAAAVRRWLEEHPADARVIAALDAATKGMAPARNVDVEAALRKVKTRAKPRSSWRYGAFAAAAAVILAVGVLVSRRVSDAPIVFGGAASLHMTGVGQRDSVRLGDGSSVIIGPASRIEVRGRTVDLTGEAFFRVAHDATRPFTVRTGNAIIRDIGTVFAVHNDAVTPVRVVVSEGVVELKHATDSVTLRAGDVGMVSERGNVEASRGAATADDLAWTQGRLVFRNASVAELGADLRRWYGVELRVPDSALVRRHFTGSFEGEPAGRVVEVIALALGARAERRGDTVYFRTPASRR